MPQEILILLEIATQCQQISKRGSLLKQKIKNNIKFIQETLLVHFAHIATSFVKLEKLIGPKQGKWKFLKHFEQIIVAHTFEHLLQILKKIIKRFRENI